MSGEILPRIASPVKMEKEKKRNALCILLEIRELEDLLLAIREESWPNFWNIKVFKLFQLR